MGGGDGDVGEDDGGVGADCGDDDGPDGVPTPPGERGRETPSFSFFLGLLPRWEKGSPSGPWSPWRGRGESPPPRLDLSLCLSLFLRSLLALFHRFVYIWRFVTPIVSKPSP